MMALWITLGSIVGVFAALGLVVVVRVLTLALRSKRLTIADRQAQLNAVQLAIARAQKELAEQKRAVTFPIDLSGKGPTQ